MENVPRDEVHTKLADALLAAVWARGGGHSSVAASSSRSQRGAARSIDVWSYVDLDGFSAALQAECDARKGVTGTERLRREDAVTTELVGNVCRAYFDVADAPKLTFWHHSDVVKGGVRVVCPILIDFQEKCACPPHQLCKCERRVANEIQYTAKMTWDGRVAYSDVRSSLNGNVQSPPMLPALRSNELWRAFLREVHGHLGVPAEVAALLAAALVVPEFAVKP